jgi:hypothetical protein
MILDFGQILLRGLRQVLVHLAVRLFHARKIARCACASRNRSVLSRFADGLAEPFTRSYSSLLTTTASGL